MTKRYSGQWKLWMGMLALTLGVLALGTAAAPAPAIVGDWSGAISAGGGSLRVVIHVTQDKDGKLAGTMDSPDQNVTGIELSIISFSQPNVHFEVRRIGGSYDGKMSKDNSEITGEWKQGGASVALTLKRASK